MRVSMVIELENYDDFKTALEEVEMLIEFAKKFEKDEKKYPVFNKSAILLLAGKFENFVETVAENYIHKINGLQLSPNIVPEILRLQHTFKTLEKIDELKKYKHNHEKAKEIFCQLEKLWGSTNDPVQIIIDCKFNYGKHGERDVKKLFEIIGIDDIFVKIKVLQIQESLIEDTDQKEIDIKGSFNSVTSLRNNILHQDASPTITVEDVEMYKEHLKLFAKNLTDFLNKKVQQLSDSR
jgi:hypothetical protein